MCCNIFRCFGWIIDLLQRFLTFILACILGCALFCGCVVVLGAGIAYGYNISVAEFLDLKRSDITVYVRRGQFGDKPDMKPPGFRRSGEDGGPEVFASNYSVDYQDQKLLDNTRPLSDAWQKAQDTSNYADKLTKYSKIKSHLMRTFPKDDGENIEELPLDVPHPTEGDVPPFANPVQFITESSDSSSEGPKMRNFLPGYRPAYYKINDTNQEEQEIPLFRRNNRKHKHKKKRPDWMEMDDSKSLYLQPNATNKFLYSREDFEDGDTETSNKPV